MSCNPQFLTARWAGQAKESPRSALEAGISDWNRSTSRLVSDHSNSDRSWHQLPGQLLGLQRRRERDPHGKGAPGRLPAEGLSHDQDRRTILRRSDAATRPVARALETDCIDLVQHHEILRYDDPHRIFDEEGANRALVDAQRAGKIRYIGFTDTRIPTSICTCST